MQLFKSNKASTNGVDVVNGIIVLGGKSFIMDHEYTHGPNSWSLQFVPGISCFVVLRNHEGQPFAIVSALTNDDGTIKSGSPGWFTTHGSHSRLVHLTQDTVRELGIEGLSDQKQARLASDVVSGAYTAWTQRTQNEAAA